MMCTKHDDDDYDDNDDLEIPSQTRWSVRKQQLFLEGLCLRPLLIADRLWFRVSSRSQHSSSAFLVHDGLHSQVAPSANSACVL